ncbi:glutamate-gated chloride channel-like [Lingula anatina]|uniref:Glutamate-gated chloride channel-like n=1 Tax=Lingula anatina TaxID=7574 RepID=A0A1S3IV20_LINAN|nr:glutamate-gated chloride channel-like [Lingula anatina]|eukprot:XP_013401389.1 glutamate-gated chloride channel-like [Lingula anatina]
MGARPFLCQRETRVETRYYDPQRPGANITVRRCALFTKYRIKLKLACLYDFLKFPMDNQTCKIEMRSYAYTTDELNFIWSTDPIQRPHDLYLPEFSLKRGSSKYCQSKTVTGEYTCIYAEFGLIRDIQFYILDIYIPTITPVPRPPACR